MKQALARQTGQEESEAIRHLAQRLAVLLARGNASLLLNRIPTFPPSEIDGHDKFAILLNPSSQHYRLYRDPTWLGRNVPT